MFVMTGVTEPNADLAGIETRKGYYDTLATDLQTMLDGVNDSVADLLEANEGPTADAFSTTMSGPTSITTHLSGLVSDAGLTATAYQTAHDSVRDGQEAMKTLAVNAADMYHQLIPVARHRPSILPLYVQLTRYNLQLLESQTVEQINAAFADLGLPESFTGLEDEGFFDDRPTVYGYYDEGIAEEWAGLTFDERLDALQRMADDYADQNGYPRITIRHRPIESDIEGGRTLGFYSPGFIGLFKGLTLNRDLLNEPDSYYLIGTVIHEMEHRGQFEGMGWRLPWQDELAGMSREEAERWRELDAWHVRRSSDVWHEYLPQPIEVGARAAERDFVNDLTYEEFLEYLS